MRGRGVRAATLALLVLPVAAGSVWAATIKGTARNDTLRGGARADTIDGKRGNDRLFGAAGNDVLVGGPGNDLLVGGAGADRLRCGPGRDTATRDVRDTVAADCEVVRGPRPTPSPPVANALYVAMGDSIAAGVVGPSNYEKGFAYVYFVRLQAEGVLQQLSNRALNGATSATMLEDQLPRALADIARPSDTKLITITVGTNDAAGAACRSGATSPSCPFAANLRLIVERLQGLLAEDPGEEQIQVMDRYNPSVGTSQEARSAAALLGLDGRAGCGDTGWNDVIHCVTSEKGVTFVDTYAPMLAGGREFLADGIHPNDAGHAALSQAFYAANTGR